MLNFSKNFVNYLDTYDKNRQNSYNGNNLLVNVEKEFLTNFKPEKTNSLYFPFPVINESDISYNAQNDALKGVFDILKKNSLFDKDVSSQISPQNKKSYEIKEQIES